MGVVYEAEDLTLKRRVALKFCSAGRNDPRLRANLLKEARAASSLSHPNIAHIYEFQENPGGEPFMAMELVTGSTLRNTLLTRRLSVEETLKVAIGVASALAEAHRRGIIHRDIKPGNIQITASGEVKVLDFGIARTGAEPGDPIDTAATMTIEGFSGTPLYMSPEQASGEPLDGRSDLFSLGVVLYECLAGKAPFAAETATSVLARLLTWEPPQPSRLNPRSPAHLDRVVARLLAKDRRERYSSGEELLEDLRAPLQQAPWLRSRRTAMAALAGAGVCAGGAAAVWVWGGRRHRGPAAAAANWYRDGLAALHNGSYHRASKALARAAEIDPSYAMAHAHLAEAWYELDYLERAKDELLKAMAARDSLSEADVLHLDAIHQTVTGEFKNAAGMYARLVSQVPAEERSVAMLDLGRAQERNQETRAAMATYKEAARMDSQNAAAWLRLGALEARTGARDEAGGSLERAESLYQTGSNVEGVTECQYVRARYARTPAQAREQIDKALSAAAVTGNEQQQIKLLLASSSAYLDSGKPAEALNDANKAIEIARAGSIENLVSRGLIDLGNALYIKDRPSDALRTIEEALDIARRNREKRSEARALVNLGSIRIQTGDPEQGWREVQAALAYYRQGSYRNEAALALILLGRASRNKGDYGGARRAFTETLDTVKLAGPSIPLALANEGLASLDFIEDRWPQALARFEETRRAFEAIGNQAGTATNALNVALMHALLGHKEQSAAALEEAADTRSVTALEIYLLEERFDEARRRAEELLKSADARDAETRRGANLMLGLALARSGAGARGLEACGKAIELAHQGRNPAAEADAQLAAAEAALAAGNRAAAGGYANRARLFFEKAGRSEPLWRAGVLALRSSGTGPDRAVAAQAGDALAQLKTVWPADDFRSYLGRPAIRRLHADLLRFNPKAPTLN
jgi:Tfp pilus assembly protein PilF